MTPDDDDREARLEDAYERLGTRQPHCQSCNERDPFALTGHIPDFNCYECASMQRGRSPIEAHHADGRRNSLFTIPIPGNDHRVLSDLQRHEWPRETLRNPHGSPLLRAAAQLRGWLNVLDILLYRIVGWVPPFLEWLDAALVQAMGQDWWVRLGWEGQL